jgi:hypothetical protein
MYTSWSTREMRKPALLWWRPLPRVRQDHPKWTATNLSAWVNSNSPVRIRGWTLLDPEHGAQVGQFRSTLWEIHPITMIEVSTDGLWVNVDDLP